MIFDKQKLRLLRRDSGRRIVYVIAEDATRAWISVFRANSGQWTNVQGVRVGELEQLSRAEARLVKKAEQAAEGLKRFLDDYR